MLSDTHPSARAVQVRILKTMSAGKKVEQVFQLNALVEQVSERFRPTNRTMSQLFALIEQVVRVLDELCIPYLVGGSIASSRYGDPRTTQAIDFVVMLQHEQVEPFVSALRDAFYVDAQMIYQAIDLHNSFNIIHYPSAFKMDFFVPAIDEWHLQLFARRRYEPIAVGDRTFTLAFASPEDVVLHKLVWYRLGNEVSERQWRDVLGVLEVQGDRLDWPYLREWADTLGVADLLQRAEGS